MAYNTHLMEPTLRFPILFPINLNIIYYIYQFQMQIKWNSN